MRAAGTPPATKMATVRLGRALLIFVLLGAALLPRSAWAHHVISWYQQPLFASRCAGGGAVPGGLLPVLTVEVNSGLVLALGVGDPSSMPGLPFDRSLMSVIYPQVHASTDGGFSWTCVNANATAVSRLHPTVLLYTPEGVPGPTPAGTTSVTATKACTRPFVCLIGGQDARPIAGAAGSYGRGLASVSCTHDGVTWWGGPDLPTPVVGAAAYQYGNIITLMGGVRGDGSGDRMMIAAEQDVKDRGVCKLSPYFWRRNKLLPRGSLTYANVTGMWAARFPPLAQPAYTPVSYPSLNPTIGGQEVAFMGGGWTQSIPSTPDTYSASYNYGTDALSQLCYTVNDGDDWAVASASGFVPTESMDRGGVVGVALLPSMLAHNNSLSGAGQVAADIGNATGGLALGVGRVLLLSAGKRVAMSLADGQWWVDVTHDWILPGARGTSLPGPSSPGDTVHAARSLPQQDGKPVFVSVDSFTARTWFGYVDSCPVTCAAGAAAGVGAMLGSPATALGSLAGLLAGGSNNNRSNATGAAQWYMASSCQRSPYDLQCSPCSVCGGGSTWTETACSLYDDTVCGPCMSCQSLGLQVLYACNATHDTQCRAARGGGGGPNQPSDGGNDGNGGGPDGPDSSPVPKGSLLPVYEGVEMMLHGCMATLWLLFVVAGGVCRRDKGKGMGMGGLGPTSGSTLPAFSSPYATAAAAWIARLGLGPSWAPRAHAFLSGPYPALLAGHACVLMYLFFDLHLVAVAVSLEASDMGHHWLASGAVAGVVSLFLGMILNTLWLDGKVAGWAWPGRKQATGQGKGKPSELSLATEGAGAAAHGRVKPRKDRAPRIATVVFAVHHVPAAWRAGLALHWPTLLARKWQRRGGAEWVTSSTAMPPASEPGAVDGTGAAPSPTTSPARPSAHVLNPLNHLPPRLRDEDEDEEEEEREGAGGGDMGAGHYPVVVYQYHWQPTGVGLTQAQSQWAPTQHMRMLSAARPGSAAAAGRAIGQGRWQGADDLNGCRPQGPPPAVAVPSTAWPVASCLLCDGMHFLLAAIVAGSMGRNAVPLMYTVLAVSAASAVLAMATYWEPRVVPERPMLLSHVPATGSHALPPALFVATRSTVAALADAGAGIQDLPPVSGDDGDGQHGLLARHLVVARASSSGSNSRTSSASGSHRLSHALPVPALAPPLRVNGTGASPMALAFGSAGPQGLLPGGRIPTLSPMGAPAAESAAAAASASATTTRPLTALASMLAAAQAAALGQAAALEPGEAQAGPGQWQRDEDEASEDEQLPSALQAEGLDGESASGVPQQQAPSLAGDGDGESMADEAGGRGSPYQASSPSPSDYTSFPQGPGSMHAHAMPPHHHHHLPYPVAFTTGQGHGHGHGHGHGQVVGVGTPGASGWPAGGAGAGAGDGDPDPGFDY